MPNELGIPHSMMKDGVPNGYSIISFDGNHYSIRYKVFGKPADYQMNIWAPEQVSSEDAPDTEVSVNVFAGSERSKVRMKVTESGRWVDMERVTRKDPYFVCMRQLEEKYNFPRVSWAAEPYETGHIFKANLPKNLLKGVHLVHIQSTDMFGQVYTARRLIRIL